MRNETEPKRVVNFLLMRKETSFARTDHHKQTKITKRTRKKLLFNWTPETFGWKHSEMVAGLEKEDEKIR